MSSHCVYDPGMHFFCENIHRFYYLCRIIFHNFWKFSLYARTCEKYRETRVVFGHLPITMNKNITETIKKAETLLLFFYSLEFLFGMNNIFWLTEAVFGFMFNLRY